MPQKTFGYDVHTFRPSNTTILIYPVGSLLPYPYSVRLSPRTLLVNTLEIEDDVGAYYLLPLEERQEGHQFYLTIPRGIGNEGSWTILLTMCWALEVQCGDPCLRSVKLTTFTHRTR